MMLDLWRSMVFGERNSQDQGQALVWSLSQYQPVAQYATGTLAVYEFRNFSEYICPETLTLLHQMMISIAE